MESRIEDMDRVNKALEFARTAHAGQLDRGGKPYIDHPLFVALQVESESEKIVALLHDVFEDTDFILDDVDFINDKEREALFVLTKMPNEPYEDYLQRVKTNSLARTVKLADLRHNSDGSRIKQLCAKDIERLQKYERAILFLKS